MDIETRVSMSQGQDKEELLRKLQGLLTDNGGLWELTANGKGVERTFHFKTFNRTWGFMKGIAEQCKTYRHHPEWTNTYNKTHIRWTTHRPEGLSMKDVDMALICDEHAEASGEIREKVKAGEDAPSNSAKSQ